MSWGGKRTGAGRPPQANTKVRLWVTVLNSTARRITQAAFNKTISLGEVIDSLAKRVDDNLVYIPVRKRKILST